MTLYKERMMKATIGNDTLELMGMVGTLHDLIYQYAAWYERPFKDVREGFSMPDSEYDKLCDAFNHAITYLEDKVHERLIDYLGSTDGVNEI